MAVIDNLALSKSKYIKGTSQNWFDAEIREKISDRDKLFFKKNQKSCLHVDKDNYNEARNEVQKLIHTKIKAYFESKLTENIGKPKDLWKRLKLLGMKYYKDICSLVKQNVVY